MADYTGYGGRCCAATDEFILNAKYAVRQVAGSRIKWYGLDNSNLIVENVPLIVYSGTQERRIQRVKAE